MRLLAFLCLAGVAGACPAAKQTNPGPDVTISTAAVLQAKFADLAGQFEKNSFGKPLVLESSDIAGALRGNVYAIVDQPYATVLGALRQPGPWCDILILHLNTKYCRPASVDGPVVLNVVIGRKSDQPIEQSFRVDFTYRIVDATTARLAVVLDSDRGPFGTRDFRIVLEAVPGKAGKTFMHLGYSYGYGTAARLGLIAYLGTAGSKKVGFTVTGTRNNGEPVYIDGLRGLIERNSMRYYLAIEAYLGALPLPPAAQFEKRLADWYAAVERYPRQLHEIGRQEYLDMKRKEYLRQQSPL